MSAKRAAIIELHRAGKTNSEMEDRLFTTLLRGFENSKVLKIVLMWKNAIFWKTPKVVDAVRARVWRNPKRFMMGMACDMNVSDKMMKNTAKTDLKLSSLKMQTCQRLTDLQKEKRLDRVKILLNKFVTVFVRESQKTS